MQLFDAVKQAVTAEQAAIRYAGITTTTKGARAWARCPLHEDHTPSLMFDSAGRYYCYSCNSNGSAIDFVAAYMKIPTMEAAQLIARDFLITTDKAEQPVKPVKRENKREKLYRLICDAKHSAREYQSKCTKERGEAAFDDELFCASVLLVSKANSEWLDILNDGTEEEAAALIGELEAALGVG